ncbi:MAG: hypothetical protein KTR33_04710, partial [Gammaproteobacteria bacterium]|nr:hypothetical protein [Gammaproteobacteria bacterium]
MHIQRVKTLITLFLNCCRVIPLLFLLAAEPLSANSFLPQSVPSDSGYYRVTLKPIEKPIPLGQLHPWQLIIKERESGKIIQPDSITLDGGMPAHGHG